MCALGHDEMSLDDKINTRLGGKGFYFTEPDGHSWEILTVSYARPAK